MMLEERVRESLGSLASEVSRAEPREVSAVKRRGRRRRIMKRSGWTAVVALVFAGTAMIAIPVDPNAIDPAATADVKTVEIADLAVMVESDVSVRSSPPTWVGLEGPQPVFDTSALGEEMPFVRSEPPGDDIPEDVTRAVYLGDLAGEPFHVYATEAPSFFDWVSEIIFGNFSGQVLGTSLNCCTGGDMDYDGGSPGLGYLYTNGVFDQGHAEWLGLGPEVAVVAYEINGQPFAWQRPVGGISSIPIEAPVTSYSIVAYDTDGAVIDRFDPPEVSAAMEIGVGPGEEILRTEPFLVVQGPPGPEPVFDTSELGEEVPLTPVTDLDGALEPLVRRSELGFLLKVALAGATPEGTLGFVYIYEEPDPDVGQIRHRCLASDGAAVCKGWPVSEVLGEALAPEPGAPPLYSVPFPTSLVWEVPPETSVVTLKVGEEVWWQRPVGGLVVFDLDVVPGDRFTLIARDTAGDGFASYQSPELG